jgi:hypothetical protein
MDVSKPTPSEETGHEFEMIEPSTRYKTNKGTKYVMHKMKKLKKIKCKSILDLIDFIMLIFFARTSCALLDRTFSSHMSESSSMPVFEARMMISKFNHPDAKQVLLLIKE